MVIEFKYMENKMMIPDVYYLETQIVNEKEYIHIVRYNCGDAYFDARYFELIEVRESVKKAWD